MRGRMGREGECADWALFFRSAHLTGRGRQKERGREGRELGREGRGADWALVGPSARLTRSEDAKRKGEEREGNWAGRGKGQIGRSFSSQHS